MSLVLPGGTDTEMPATLDRSRLPPEYPSHERSRVSAERVARAVVKAIAGKHLEIHIPWWNRPGLWVSTVSPSLTDRLIRRSYGNSLTKN